MVRKRRALRILLGWAVGLVATIGVVAPAIANEFAFGQLVAGSAIYTGISGSAAIRTDPATVAGVAFVHPVQVDTGALGGSFIGLGTVNALASRELNA